MVRVVEQLVAVEEEQVAQVVVEEVEPLVEQAGYLSRYQNQIYYHHHYRFLHHYPLHIFCCLFHGSRVSHWPMLVASHMMVRTEPSSSPTSVIHQTGFGATDARRLERHVCCLHYHHPTIWCQMVAVSRSLPMRCACGCATEYRTTALCYRVPYHRQRLSWETPSRMRF